jgi:hypothetical protein
MNFGPLIGRTLTAVEATIVVITERRRDCMALPEPSPGAFV